MSSRRSVRTLLCGLALCVFSVATAQEPAASKKARGEPARTDLARIESEIKATMAETLRSTQAEDLEAMMKTVHPNSPLYETTRHQISQVFGKNLQLKYELLSVRFLLLDGDYALARIHQRTTKSPPVGFKNNEIDMIVVLRKDNRTWKIWNQVILEIKFLNS